MVDHVLELQVLKRTLEAPGGVCATLKAMIASPNSGLTTADTADLMAPIKAAINGKSNLFFLDRKLNQVVRLSLESQSHQLKLMINRNGTK
jgi:hypothetical protein